MGTMTITLKNIPRRLHTELKRQADNNHRSLNGEILSCLENKVFSQPMDRQILLEDIRKTRSGLSLWLDQKSLDAFKNEGRA